MRGKPQVARGIRVWDEWRAWGAAAREYTQKTQGFAGENPLTTGLHHNYSYGVFAPLWGFSGSGGCLADQLGPRQDGEGVPTTSACLR